MVITVDLVSGAVGLDAPEDCARFHVALRGGGDRAALDDALTRAGAGRLDGDGALIRVDAVRRLAAGRVLPGWEASFAKMLDYARSKGWLDDGGAAIRAHVEEEGEQQ